MPLFNQIASAVGVVYDFVEDVAYSAATKVTKAVFALRQMEASAYIAHASQKEELYIKELSSQYGELSHAEIQRYINDNHIAQDLDMAQKHDGAVELKTHKVVLLSAERKVHEYLAAAQVLDVSKCDAEMSELLRNAFGAIMDAQHDQTYNIGVSYVLIENIVLYRCPAIRNAIAPELRPYVDINEMLQIIHTLQVKLDNELTNNQILDAIISPTKTQDACTSTTPDISDAAPDYTDVVGVEATHNLHNLLEQTIEVLVFDIADTYAANLQTMQQCGIALEMHPRMCDVRTESIKYHELVATQIFAAMAAQRKLHYVMQCSFNTNQSLLMDMAVRYSYNDSYIDAQSPVGDINQLIQVQIAHMIQTYYTYHILEEFINYSLAANDTHISSVLFLATSRQVRVAMSILSSDILDAATIDMAVRLTEHIYSSVLVYVLNRYGNDYNELQIQHLLYNEYADHRDDIIMAAMRYAFNKAPICVLMKMENLSLEERTAVHTILGAINPLYGHNNQQFVKQLHEYARHIIDNLQNVSFNAFRMRAAPIILNACRAQIERPIINAVQTTALIIDGTVDDFSIRYNEHNVACIIDLVAQGLSDNNLNLRNIMEYVIDDALSKMRNAYDLNIMVMSSTVQQTYRTHLMYALADLLMHKVYTSSIADMFNYSKTALVVAGGAILATVGTQPFHYPFQLLQQALHNVTDVLY